ncbi:hypothetical protein D6T63_06545 [Arthrobacter cheniae]|uniref:CobQ/CobB/MinD/ParA nucleotide binding domain-containing protein n=2 Tax=Arthrobacter cheniae TaxID=1258888 RepID=A0A3A5M5K9_9MICC|nr:hypothetical protein D6T63_06545 [Arthrobacter cheniae]
MSAMTTSTERRTTRTDPFETPEERLRRVLRTRPADGALRTLAHNVTDLFRSDAYVEELTRAAAGTQVPVTTGRRIAVVGSRGGAGKTTTAALLARVFAALRSDTIAAVDAGTGLGTLSLRLGLDSAPTAADLAAAEPATTVEELSRTMGRAQENLLIAGSGAGRTAEPPLTGTDNERASRLARTISRFCPVTVYDCGTGMHFAPALWSLDQAHAALFVTPATVAGVEDALAVAYRRPEAGEPGHVPMLVVVVSVDDNAALDAGRQAKRLSDAGIPAVHIDYDRHLAAGVELDLGLLARKTRLQVSALASRALALAIDGRAG